MALDRKSLDKQRELNNLPPLTDEEFNTLSGGGSVDDTEKVKAEQERLAAEAEAKRLADEKAAKGEPQLREYTDEELLQLVAQKTGRQAKSWEDLKPTAEVIDAEKAKEERENNKFTWALENKIFKKQEYEGFIADSKDPVDLVYRQRLQEALKEDAELDENEFRAEFEDEFGLSAEKTSRRYKNGQDTLNRLSNAILKSTYGSIYELDNKYSQFEKQQQEKIQRNQKIKDGAESYKKALDTVKAQLKKITAHVGEGDSSEEYEVEMLDESIDNVIGMMSDPEWASEQILKGYTEADLKDIAWTTVLKENFPFITKKIVDQALVKKAKGTKGMLSLDSGGSGSGDYALSEAQQKLKSIIEENTPAKAEAN